MTEEERRKEKEDEERQDSSGSSKPFHFKVVTLVMANIEVKDLQKMMMIATQPSSVPRC